LEKFLKIRKMLNQEYLETELLLRKEKLRKRKNVGNMRENMRIQGMKNVYIWISLMAK